MQVYELARVVMVDLIRLHQNPYRWIGGGPLGDLIGVF
jgi:hypothetical protein